MTATIRDVRTLRPLRWRRLPGAVADLWHVRGEAGGGGFYVSPDPRLVILRGPGAAALRLRSTEGGPWIEGVRAFFVPGGAPLWSELRKGSEFSHLDVHLEGGPLAQRLGAAAREMTAPVFLRDDGAGEAEQPGALARIEALAPMMEAEIAAPTRPALMLDGLLSAALAEVMALEPSSAPAAPEERGGLPPWVLRRLTEHVRRDPSRRISVDELAEIAGLSRSWFTRAFKRSRGETPQRWLSALRLEAAEAMMAQDELPLAEIAAAAGFADQAHLTRVFREARGQTPAAWRRDRRDRRAPAADPGLPPGAARPISRALASKRGAPVQSPARFPS